MIGLRFEKYMFGILDLVVDFNDYVVNIRNYQW